MDEQLCAILRGRGLASARIRQHVRCAVRELYCALHLAGLLARSALQRDIHKPFVVDGK